MVTLIEGINEIKLKGVSSNYKVRIDSLKVSMCAEAEPNNYLPNSDLNEKFSALTTQVNIALAQISAL